MIKHASILLAAALLPVLIASCGRPESLSQGSGTCAPNQAVILVYDGLLQNLCGCGEAPGISNTQEAPFSCTVRAGSKVIFNFSNSQLVHQLIPINNSEFVPSSVADPTGVVRVVSHEITFNHPGAFGFTDVFVSGLRGTIVVQ